MQLHYAPFPADLSLVVPVETVERVKLLTLLPHFIARDQLRFMPTSVFPTPPFDPPTGWNMTYPFKSIPGYEFAKDKWFYPKTLKLLTRQSSVIHFVQGQASYILEVDPDTSQAGQAFNMESNDFHVLYMKCRNRRHKGAMMSVQVVYGEAVDLSNKPDAWKKWGCKVRVSVSFCGLSVIICELSVIICKYL